MTGPSLLRQPGDQLGQPHQSLDVEGRAPAGDHHEGIRLAEVRPRVGEANELPSIAVDVHPTLAPGAAVVRKLELPPAQRVEGMGHPNDSCRILRIACS